MNDQLLFDTARVCCHQHWQKAELLIQKANVRRHILREVLHLTGGIYSDPSNYINKYGKEPCAHQIYVDKDWDGHRVRKLRTPKLLAKAREQLKCSSLTGMPMEDHLIGKNNHWRSPCYGPKILSYGNNSGESYLSDLSLAYLEDTGHYVANYSNAGWLIPHSVSETAVDSMLVPLTQNDGPSQKYPLSPGFRLWARQEGCNLVALGDVQKQNKVCSNDADSDLDWVLLGILVAAAIIAIICMIVCWRRIRLCCGVHPDQKDWNKILKLRHGRYSSTGYYLTFIGVIWAVAGLVLLIFAIYSLATISPDVTTMWDGQAQLAPTILCLGAFTLVVSIMAIEGAWSNRPSISLIVYFYVCFFFLMICLVIPIVPLVLTDEDLWIGAQESFSYVWPDLDSTPAMDQFVDSELPTYVSWIVFVGIVCIASAIAGIVCSILLLTVRVVMRTFEMVLCFVLFVIGFGLATYAMTYFWYLDAYIHATAIIPAVLLMLVGFIGIFAACQKEKRYCLIYTWQIAAAVFLVVGIVAASIFVAIAMPPTPEDTAVPTTCYELEGAPVVCEGAAGMCCSCISRKGDLNDIITDANSTSINASRRALGPVKLVTRCAKSCQHVPGYSCTEVVGDVTTPTPPSETYPFMNIDPYIRSLNNARITEILITITCPEPASMFGLETLIDWTTMDLRVFAVMLYACCAIILGILVVIWFIICCNDSYWGIMKANYRAQGGAAAQGITKRGGIIAKRIKTTRKMGIKKIITRTIASNGVTTNVTGFTTSGTEGDITNTLAANQLATNLAANGNTIIVQANDTTRPGMFKRMKKTIKTQFTPGGVTTSVTKGDVANTLAASKRTTMTANSNAAIVKTNARGAGVIERIQKTIKSKFASDFITTSATEDDIATYAGVNKSTT